jgi:hypothetical protein
MKRKPRKLDFDKEMDKLIKEASSKPFKPCAWYNRDGDIVEAAWEDCDYHAEWINHQVTLLRAERKGPNGGLPGRIIGVQIWALDEDGKNRRISSVILGERP